MKTNRTILLALLLLGVTGSYAGALEEELTIPAEDPKGVTLKLPKGRYRAEIAGGAITLFFPIHPQYCWLYALCIGTKGEGGEEEPDIGTLYSEPNPKALTQAEAEKMAMEAVKHRDAGSSIDFDLNKEQTVRFWVSDFDYTDNMGSERVRVYSLRK